MPDFDINNLYAVDPRPFYRAVLDGPGQAGELLDAHPIEQRPILVWNAAIKSINHYFNGRRPGRRVRQALLDQYAPDADRFTTEMGTDPIPIIDMYIETAFNPDASAKLAAAVSMDVLCETALLIPPVIASAYRWKEGEREAFIVALYLFDHTYASRRSQAEPDRLHPSGTLTFGKAARTGSSPWPQVFDSGLATSPGATNWQSGRSQKPAGEGSTPSRGTAFLGWVAGAIADTRVSILASWNVLDVSTWRVGGIGAQLGC